VGSVYKKNGAWYLRYKDRSGRWRAKHSGIKVAPDSEQEARAVLAEVESSVKAGYGLHPSVSVAEYAQRWLERREAAKVRSAKNDRTAIDRHVLPYIGKLPLRSVRGRDLRELVARWAGNGVPAPRYQVTIYGLVRQMFADAATYDELIGSSPCPTGRSARLPRKADKDPAWRMGAVFDRAEVPKIIGSESDPGWRAYWGLLFLAGLRVGEASALTWDDYDDALQPLGMLRVTKAYDTHHAEVKSTKAETPRMVPVHPWLAALLASAPRVHKLIMPYPGRKEHLRNDRVNRQFREHLARLGLRHRRVHDARRTFITLARADGARGSAASLTGGEE
jgi:integrase